MALSVPLFIVALFHCSKVIDGAPMPFWPYHGRNDAVCDKYRNRCTRNKDCWCENEDLQCNFVFMKGRKECTAENRHEYAMAYMPRSTTPQISQMCFKYLHGCYHDNDCKCEYGEYLYCKQLSIQMKGLCLTQSEDIPSWFTPFSPTFKPSPTTSRNLITTPTSPATTKWQCENLGATCVEDTDCLCEHSDELWCIYVPETQDHYCMPEEWSPTDHPPTSPRGTQPPPITEECEMFALPCSSNTDCFCEESDELRCVYVHEEKENLCLLSDDWNQKGPSTHQHPLSTTKDETWKTKDKPISVSKRPWSPSKSGISVPDGGSDHGGNPRTETFPTTKSPWKFWGSKSISVGKTKTSKEGDHITLTAFKELMLDVPVQSLHEVINELDGKKLIK